MFLFGYNFAISFSW